MGEAYLSRARETADPIFYTRADPIFYARAQRAFGAALRRAPRDLGALIGAGTLVGLRHDFREQLRLGRLAVERAPQLALPYTVVADAQVELGRYDAAARSIQRLLDPRPGLASYSRASYFRELSGDLPGAVEAMRLAVSAGGTPESVAYVGVLLGDLELQRGRLGAARLAYTSALRSLPRYPAGMVGLARVDAAGGRLGRAAVRLRRASERLPLAATLVLLGDVERRRGRRAAADSALGGAAAQLRLQRASATEPDAESVLFEGRSRAPGTSGPDGPPRLGARTERPLGRRARLGADPGRPAARRLRWARRALARGALDPLFRYHAGMVALAAGGDGRRDLELAVGGGGLLSPSQLQRARAALR